MSEPRVAIVGAGPAGLATAACLRQRSISFHLLDRRGSTGGAYHDLRPALQLASPTRYNQLPGLATDGIGEYTRAGEYLGYLARYAAHHQLAAESFELQRIVRRNEKFVLCSNDREIAVAQVVVATGMWDFPVRVALAGAGPPLVVMHAREWRGQAAHPDARVLVVGGATTAVEIAEEIAGAERRVIVAARSGVHLAPQRVLGVDIHTFAGPLERLPRWLTRRWCGRHPTLPGTDLGFSRLRNAGLIDVRPSVARCDGNIVHFVDGSEAEVDLVVLATGFRFATPFLPEEVARASAGHLEAKDNESVTWPGLFTVGSPCAATLASEFLRGIARDAERVADTIAQRLR